MFRRLATRAVRHRVIVMLVWGLVAALAFPLSIRVDHVLTGSFGEATDPELLTVRQAMADFPGQSPQNAVLVLRSDAATLRAGTEAFDAVARDAVAALRRTPGVGTVTPYYQAGVPRKLVVGPDDRTAVILIGLTSDTLLAAEEATPVLRAAIRSVPRPDDMALLLTGAPAIYYDAIVAGKRDTTRAEIVALPITGIALVLAFAALVAAAIPLVIGLLSVTVTLAVLFVLGSVFHVFLNSFAQTVATMVGLAVGIDYALLVVSRYREALDRDPDPVRAAIATGTTAGRTVAVSGIAVAVSLGALIIPDSPILRSMGYAGVSAVLVALLAALTIVPALLASLGSNIDAPFRIHHWLTRTASFTRPGWRRWVTRVLRHPLRYTVLALVILVGLALPARDLVADLPGAEALPRESESRRGADALAAMNGAGALNPLSILVDAGGPGNAFTAPFIDASLEATRRLEALPGVAGVIGPTTGPALFGASAYRVLYATEEAARNGPLATLADATISRGGGRALFTIVPDAQLTRNAALGLRAQAQQLLQEFPALHPASASYGGWALESAAIFSDTWSYFPRMAVAVLLVTFLLLVLAFRSLLVPLKAVVLNGFSVLASYGVLVAVFQYGWGSSLLGVAPARDPARLDFLIPILLFAVIFGLSMDYEVFLVARIREHHLAGVNDTEAIVSAIERTGPVITWAAVIMTTVFLAFLTASSPYIVQTGLPLAVAILLDATLVRVVLVPAFMRLAGRWNWWLPAWLDRALPHAQLEPAPAEPVPPGSPH